jgi:hypothetical protein
LKKLQKGLAAAKGDFAARKHRHHEEEAMSLAIDVQCDEERASIRYSKKWQKMRRQIIQGFRLKWKKWALFQWAPKSSEWVKLSLPHGALDPKASYRVVIRPQDRNKRARPGIGRRLERRRAERESGSSISKLVKFNWENGEGEPMTSLPIRIQKRTPSPPLRILTPQRLPVTGQVITPERIWVDLLYAGHRKSVEVLSTVSQIEVEQLASDIFLAPIKVWNFTTPVNGVSYKCLIDRCPPAPKGEVVALSLVKTAEKRKRKADHEAACLTGEGGRKLNGLKKRAKSVERAERRDKRLNIRKAACPTGDCQIPWTVEVESSDEEVQGAETARKLKETQEVETAGN